MEHSIRQVRYAGENRHGTKPRIWRGSLLANMSRESHSRVLKKNSVLLP